MNVLWLDSSRPANLPVPFRIKAFGTIGIIAIVLACAEAITGVHQNALDAVPAGAICDTDSDCAEKYPAHNGDPD
jgi:hypothetical protein